MSLRARVLAGMAVIGLLLGFVAVVVTRTTRANLLEQVDAQLIAASSGRDFGFDRRPPDNDDAPERPSSLYVGVVGSDGAVTTLFTPNLLGTDPPLPRFTSAAITAGAESGKPFTVASTGSLRYRARVASDQHGGVAVVAVPLTDVDRAVDRLVAVEAVATLAILAVLALVSWWVVHLGIRPLKKMTATASAIAAGDLSHRVPDVAAGTEAGELGLALNAMLGRIEEAFDERSRSEERLRRFVADASHELRTPVTTIRGYAELYRSGGLDESDELGEAMRRTEQEAVRMGKLIDDMLLLARLDQGRPLEREPVDLSAIADDAARDARAVDPGRAVTATTNGPLVVLGDGDRLRQVVANVVGNALVHTSEGTAIDITAGADGGTGYVEVHDHGAGMRPEVADRVFERFFRADPSRSRHRGGSGLGLAIVHATVAAHGGTVRLDTAPGRGTTVRIELPLAPA